MSSKQEPRYALSLSLEEAAFGCEKVINVKISDICPSCNGSRGEFTGNPNVCMTCHGTGEIYQSHPVPVQIAPGVKDGYQLHINAKKQTEAQREIPEGINVLISIKAHKLFQRSGDDIIYELPLDFAQAALGTEVTVPTLKGNAKLKIPGGVQTGKTFRLRKKGITHLERKGKGDQVVMVRVVTPTSLSEKQKELIEQLGKTLSVSE